GNRQPLAALRAAALEHEPAVLGGHPHAEAMGLGPATRIRLIGSLALLRSRHLFLETVRRTAPVSGPGRNLNTTEEFAKPQPELACVTVRGSFPGCDRHRAGTFGLFPKISTTCGKR